MPHKNLFPVLGILLALSSHAFAEDKVPYGDVGVVELDQTCEGTSCLTVGIMHVNSDESRQSAEQLIVGFTKNADQVTIVAPSASEEPLARGQITFAPIANSAQNHREAFAQMSKVLTHSKQLISQAGSQSMRSAARLSKAIGSKSLAVATYLPKKMYTSVKTRSKEEITYVIMQAKISGATYYYLVLMQGVNPALDATLIASLVASFKASSQYFNPSLTKILRDKGFTSILNKIYLSKTSQELGHFGNRVLFSMVLPLMVLGAIDIAHDTVPNITYEEGAKILDVSAKSTLATHFWAKSISDILKADNPSPRARLWANRMSISVSVAASLVVASSFSGWDISTPAFTTIFLTGGALYLKKPIFKMTESSYRHSVATVRSLPRLASYLNEKACQALRFTLGLH